MSDKINAFNDFGFSNSPSAAANPNSDLKPPIPKEYLNGRNAVSIRDEFVKIKSRNGLFERAYDWLKNKTGLGFGSKKLESEISAYENGTESEKDVRDKLAKYRSSQYNAQQILGDAASFTAGMGVFSAVNNRLKILATKNKLNINPFAMITDVIPEKHPLNKLLSSIKNMPVVKRLAIAGLFSAVAGAFAKSIIVSVDRIGSKGYKTNIPKDKEHKSERDKDRKALTREKNRENFKNLYTGGLNGIISGFAGIAGGIIGVPLVILSNLGLRYVQSQKDSGNKPSINDFKDKFKDNAIMNGAASLLIAIPLFKKAHYNRILSKNLDAVASKLKGVELKFPFDAPTTAYSELKEMLLSSPKLSQIIDDSHISVGKKIEKLISENIFAAKFIQNSGNSNELARALKESCPPSRTVEEAEELIAQTFGNKYSVSKLLGVGTVAETYLAKNTETGKEVCIKLLKNGINTEKINNDKEKMIQIVKSKIFDEKQLQYYIKNIEDLAEAIAKEVDLNNELNSAVELAKFSKYANVVKPFEIKNNIYVMEKAPGISLKTLQDVSSLEASKNYYSKMLAKFVKEKNNFGINYYKEELENIEKRIAQIKENSPDFATIDITPREIDRLLSQYIKVKTEQFDSIYKGGKTLHGDIHPGNIFVDLNALKSGRGKALTLVDTGNTIQLSMEQSKSALLLNHYIKRGNVKDIASYVTEGAILPDGMTEKAALEIVETDLRKIFFDNESALQYMNNDSLLALTSNIMRKHNIIPGSTQLNLEKAKHASDQSFHDIVQSLVNTKYSSLNTESKKDKAKLTFMISKDVASWGARLLKSKKLQELHNMSQYPFKQIITNAKNPNMPATNSEDYLTYKFKQDMTNTFETLKYDSDV